MAETRDSPRKVPMQVLALGMSRSGTMSVKEALQLLGYNRVGHGMAMANNSDEMKAWRKAIDAKFFGIGKPYGRNEFDILLGEYAALTDAPSIYFADELLAAYPEAKVVLVEREIEAWYTSFERAVILPLFGPMGSFARWVIEPLSGYKAPTTCYRCVSAYFGATNVQGMQNVARRVYRAHNQHIRDVVPPEKLLILDLAQGWEPLCDFLGKDVPEVPFPKVNDWVAHKAGRSKLRRDLFRQLLGNFAKLAAAVAVVGIAAYYAANSLPKSP